MDFMDEDDMSGHHRPPPPPFGEFDHPNFKKMKHGEHPMKFNKKMMKMRNLDHMKTRGAFVTFVMWLCVFVAAAIGFRASK